MIYDTINPQIIKFILEKIPNHARILDVGCGTGKLGKLLKLRASCYLTGIEIDREAADIAKEAYDKLVIMNLEDLVNEKCPLEGMDQYDFVVLGDILEHVTNPDNLLRCFRNSLKADGFLIASIPNVANWMIRIGLLFGNFDYSGGILDQSHLRFYTYKTAKELLVRNGLKIVAVVNNNHTAPIRFLGKIWKRLFAFQFVFKCVKSELI
jgi:2-polyprenyl-3-methyl-5-hydroxy-6-metoxy-1,4-benzoquinol methylase